MSLFLLCIILALGLFKRVDGVKSVSWDEKSFLVDEKRTFLIAGSVHYPRASAQEWPKIMDSMLSSGLNTLQTYVFWDLHEKVEGKFIFGGEALANSNEDLIAFLRLAQTKGLFVNLRFGPYICGEWNFGGIPVWMREVTNEDGKRTTFRTNDDAWLKKMLTFVSTALNAVESEGLFAGERDGPVVMLQIENEYGNVQDFYGTGGAEYVSKLAQYVESHKDLVPAWIMCQQGEGKGTAPPASIINTCNGFYCDDWIAEHAADWPHQPHMYTELWPGWFQKFGEAVPHRPAADVAFSVLRWFAKGGSYLNYYMAFGGTNFGRSVGGPNIVQSYDYDVAINEYGLRSEPKFSLLQQMHAALYAVQDSVFGSSQIPVAVPLANEASCESHTYAMATSTGYSCVSFLSNSGSSACTFGTSTNVPAWSVSIMTGTSTSGCDVFDVLQETFNSKKSVATLISNKLVATPVDVVVTEGKSLQEKIPSSGRLSTHFSHMTPVMWLVSDEPLEQLDVTHDRTDYLWYSTTVKVPDSDNSTASDMTNVSLREHAVLKFDVGTGAGAACRLWINEDENHSGEKSVPPVHVQLYVTYRYEVTLSKRRPNTIDILCVGAGLQNYGPHLESIKTGIVNKVTLDGTALVGWKHSVGLLGEAIDYGGVSTISTIDPAKRAELIHELEGVKSCTDLCWRSLKMTLKNKVDSASSYALDLSAIGKGAVWVNGHMLGRYYSINAHQSNLCTPCEETTYVGEYNESQCRTGCGEPSQRFYKIPTDWLLDGDNEIVVFEEIRGVKSVAEGVILVQIAMVEK